MRVRTICTTILSLLLAIQTFAYNPFTIHASTWSRIVTEDATRQNSSMVGNGWMDLSEKWHIEDGRLVGIWSGDPESLGSSYLMRPELYQDERTVLTIPEGSWTTSNSVGYEVAVRTKHTNNGYTGYVARFTPNVGLTIFSLTAGNGFVILSNVDSPSNIVSGSALTLTLTAQDLAPTSVTASISYTNTGSVLAETSVVDSTSDLQTIGASAVGIAGSSGQHAEITLGTITTYTADANYSPIFSYRVGFIGDSITYGYGAPAGQGSVDRTAIYLAAEGPATVSVYNRGSNGATTTDWTPGHGLFEGAVSTFHSQNVNIVSLMLGTNDSKNTLNVTPAAYRANLVTIISSLKLEGFNTIVLQYPPSIILPRYNWDITANDVLRQYMQQIDSLVDGTSVLLGDTTMFDYFLSHPEELPDKLHPNSVGYDHMGQAWAKAIHRSVSHANVSYNPGTITAENIGTSNGRAVRYTTSTPTAGFPTYRYQWFKSTTRGQLGNPIIGATSPIYEANMDLVNRTISYYTVRYQDLTGRYVYSRQTNGRSFKLQGNLGLSEMDGEITIK